MTKQTPTERFEDKVERIPFHSCWEWTAALAKNGYGRFGANGKVYQAHRWVYEQMFGPVASGLELDHLCRNRACVNPAHMEPVTRSQNLARSPVVRDRMRKLGLLKRKYDLPEGVTIDNRRHGRYFAQARVNGKTVYLGSSNTSSGAGELYLAFRNGMVN